MTHLLSFITSMMKADATSTSMLCCTMLSLHEYKIHCRQAQSAALATVAFSLTVVITQSSFFHINGHVERQDPCLEMSCLSAAPSNVASKRLLFKQTTLCWRTLISWSVKQKCKRKPTLSLYASPKKNPVA